MTRITKAPVRVLTHDEVSKATPTTDAFRAEVQQRHAFERAMVACGYFADLFEGWFFGEFEWSYYDPRANMMWEVWKAAQLTPHKEKVPMDLITVEVHGPAGSGKSAIAQIVAHVLAQLELNASTDLAVDLRSVGNLEAAVDAIKARGTQIVVRETQTRKGQ